MTSSMPSNNYELLQIFNWRDMNYNLAIGKQKLLLITLQKKKQYFALLTFKTFCILLFVNDNGIHTTGGHQRNNREIVLT